MSLINILLQETETIFSEHDPSDLENDVAFFNGKVFPRINRALPSDNTQQNREDLRQLKDEYSSEEESENEDLEQSLEAESENEEQRLLKGINRTFKMLEILGQLMRNFPYSFDAEVKGRITKSCFLVGLRCISAIHAKMQSDWEGWKTYFEAQFIEQYPQDSERLNRQRAEALANYFATLVVENVISKISHSVGHEKLSEIYRDIKEDRVKISLALVKLSIQLNYLSGVPLSDIKNLKEQLYSNLLGEEVLFDMVVEFMAYQYIKHDMRQKLSALFEIKNSNRLLLGEKKS